MQNNQNVLLATILSAMVLVGWMWLYEKPKAEEYQKRQTEIAALKPQQNAPDAVSSLSPGTTSQQHIVDETTKEEPVVITNNLLERKEAIEESVSQRINISSEDLSGSIYLKGARFDDLVLNNYRQSIEDNSEKVTLLSPFEAVERYFADFGWVSSDKSLDLPRSDTIWKADSDHLSPGNSLTLSWN